MSANTMNNKQLALFQDMMKGAEGKMVEANLLTVFDVEAVARVKEYYTRRLGVELGPYALAKNPLPKDTETPEYSTKSVKIDHEVIEAACVIASGFMGTTPERVKESFMNYYTQLELFNQEKKKST